MFAKLAIICTLAVVTSAISPGYLSSAYALGSQAEHTIRGYGGLSSVSKQAKAVDSAYATVRKSDIRVTNDAAYAPHSVVPYQYTTHGHAYSTPAFAHGYAGPATIAHGYHAPAGTITYSRHGYAPATLTHGYAAPTSVAHGYAAPTQQLQLAHAYAPQNTVAHHGYPSLGYRTVSAPSLGYRTVSAPTTTVTKQVATVPTGLGISYSPSTAVATSTFSGYGVHYGY